MILSLDSNTLIDLIRGRSPDVRERYRDAVGAGLELVVSTVVMHELVLGIALSREPQAQRERMAETLLGLPVVELSAEDVEATGRLAARLRLAGRPIGDLDTLIAGQALARGWSLVTRNVRHFGRVEGLPMIDWTVGPDLLTANDITVRLAEDG